MSKRVLLGEFELLVLAALLRLGDDAYGASVYREIESRAKRRVTIGAVYTTLGRLEKRGLVESRLGDPTPVRGGRAKRYVRICGAGMEALRASTDGLRSLLEGTELEWTNPAIST